MKLKWTGKRTLLTVALLAGVGLLYVQGSDQRREEGRDGNGSPASSESTSECRVAATADGVRVRNAPAIADGNIVDELASGEETDAVKEIQNGFRKLGEGRWVSVDYVRILDGSDC